MRDLIDDIFVGTFDSPQLSELEDQAKFDLSDLTKLGNRLAMTTDSYVVDPLFFPGGDIGKLAITGTVNDLAGVQVVTGDTKVVPRGAADKLFINTAGVGVIREGVDINASNAQPGDAVIINGLIGDHGAEIGETPAGRVILKTQFGGDRVIDMLVGEQLPGIC